jgi:hypothetical protein
MRFVKPRMPFPENFLVELGGEADPGITGCDILRSSCCRETIAALKSKSASAFLERVRFWGKLERTLWCSGAVVQWLFPVFGRPCHY